MSAFSFPKWENDAYFFVIVTVMWVNPWKVKIKKKFLKVNFFPVISGITEFWFYCQAVTMTTRWILYMSAPEKWACVLICSNQMLEMPLPNAITDIFIERGHSALLPVRTERKCKKWTHVSSLNGTWQYLEMLSITFITTFLCFWYATKSKNW